MDDFWVPSTLSVPDLDFQFYGLILSEFWRSIKGKTAERSVSHLFQSVKSVFVTPGTPRIYGQKLVADAISGSFNSKVLPFKSTAQPRTDFPVSYSQERLWFLEQMFPGSPLHNLNSALLLTGPIDVENLDRALNEVVNHHEILRTIFIAKDGQPIQRVLPELRIRSYVIDFDSFGERTKKRKIREAIAQEIHQGFDLMNGPLLRIKLLKTSSNRHIMLLTFHRMIADETSISNFIQELSHYYKSQMSDIDSAALKNSIQYKDFSVWQRNSFDGSIKAKSLSHWIEQLRGAPGVTAIPSDRPRPAVQTHRGSIFRSSLDENTTGRIKGLCREEVVSIFVTLLSAFKLLLHRYTREEDILVGSVIPSRNREELETLLGPVSNALVFRTTISNDLTFRELLQRVRATCVQAYENQDVPFEKIVEEIQPERSLSHSPLFQINFVADNTPIANYHFQGIVAEPYEVDNENARFDLSVAFKEGPNSIDFAWKFNSDLFNASTIERMALNYQTLIQSILNKPDNKLSEFDILTSAETQQVLVDWNRTESNFPSSSRMEELFQKRTALTPRALAVISGRRRLTYQELDDASNQLARLLLKKGVGTGKVAALYMNRSADMTISLLAIMKSGACYVPVDPSYPPDRIEFMMKDSNAAIILTQQSLKDKIDPSSNVICVDTEWPSIAQESKHRLPVQGSSTDPAYVIYTSGSTGIPKGVLVSHRNLVNSAIASVKSYQLKSDDRLLQFASISFDVAAEEIYPAWCIGAAVVLRTEEMLSTFGEFLRSIEKEKISVLNLPTAFWQELVQELHGSDLVLPSSVRTMIVGGEKCSYPIYKQWLDVAADSVEFYNGYGPTETTITSTIWHRSPDDKTVDELQDLPIGRPIANTRTYVLDTAMKPVPVGVPGELWIGGAGVSLGYLNRAELSDSKFLLDPFVNDGSSRMYRTGDIVRYLPDGNLQFFGRSDNQVKVRGYRIELGEIEAALLNHNAIKEAAVLAPMVGGSRRLIAYVVLQKRNLTPRELKNFLKQSLPDYMVPSSIIFMDVLPRTANGKIDRKALPASNDLNKELGKSYVAPRDDLELKLTRIWQKMLNVSKVGVHDNFFDLGGHSLLAVSLFSQIEKITGKNLPLATLFAAPTIEQLAALLRKQDWQPQWSSLVPIQPNGTRTPFFCIHAVGGNVVGYHPLAHYMLHDQPVYGLQARGLDGKQSPVLSIEQMASDYIKEIKSVQPKGPYRLGGLSFGGIVSFEIARQLTEQGEKVGLLAMFDTDPPGISNPGSQQEYQGAVTGIIERISYHSRKILFGKSRISYLRNRIKTTRRVMRRRFSLLIYYIYQRLGKPLPSTLLRVQEASFQALREYTPGYFNGEITLFLASQRSLGERIPPEVGWKQFAESIRIAKVPGDHVGILKEPNVQLLARLLQEFLDESHLTEHTEEEVIV